MKFCPKCGKKGIKGDFCSKCYNKMIGSVIEFKDIDIKVCPVCMTYFHKSRQIRFDDFSVIVRKVAKDNIKEKISAEITPIIPEMELRPGKKYSFEVEIALSPKEKYYLPVNIEMIRCKNCGKMGTQYFEGDLQLRNPNKEVIDFIRNDVSKQKGKGVFITKERKVGKGIDFQITSQRYLQNLGNRLQKEFGGILKINPRLFSRDKMTSKNVYRINVYFELLPFNVGDVVRCKNKLIRISSTGKQVAGNNLLTGKRTSFSCKDQFEVFKKKKVEVVKTYPEIEVLDPETYQSVKVQNKKKAKQGDMVDVIDDGGKFYIV